MKFTRAWRGSLFIVLALAVATLAIVACGSRVRGIQIDLAKETAEREVYVPKNDVEFKNYDDRQKLADDPLTILWCTFFPQTVGQEVFTVPITGKLTSSNKRPYQTEYKDNGTDDEYYPELPGPDKMFGHSSEYRYGFDPTRTIYSDFTDLASFCTNAPTVWQANKTRIVVDIDPRLADITRRAREAFGKNDPKLALKILQEAETPAKNP